jgi:large subunit ribosomal protein L13
LPLPTPTLPPKQGKDKPTFQPNQDDGDVVVVVNAGDIELTGRKWDQKLYRWHTGYPGGLKERTAKDMFARKPDSILREAVLGMLPKNNLRRVRPGLGWAGGGAGQLF